MYCQRGHAGHDEGCGFVAAESGRVHASVATCFVRCAKLLRARLEAVVSKNDRDDSVLNLGGRESVWSPEQAQNRGLKSANATRDPTDHRELAAFYYTLLH